MTAPLPPSCCVALGDGALGDVDATALADVFKALADPARIRLLSMVASAPDGDESPAPPAPARAAQPLVEPLSPRELEVLALIAEGLTNKEIAERHVP